jgi:23S rRNA (pseudouridine1915-N3)-methyltransferase
VTKAPQTNRSSLILGTNGSDRLAKDTLLIRKKVVSFRPERLLNRNCRYMKIVLLVVGKTDNASFSEIIEEYKKRLVHYIPFELVVISDIKNTKHLSESQQKEKEGELILKTLQPGDYCVLLDEKGQIYTSEELAFYIEKKTHAVPKRLIFITGGPYGFSESVYKSASEKMSLSKMTFSHQMIRMMFIEQLYRAMTILNNEPYHHE